MYIPIKECRYVKDPQTNAVYLRATLIEKGISKSHIIQRLPSTFVEVEEEGKFYIQSKDSFVHERSKKRNVENLVKLNHKLRLHLQYINGVEALWYIKTAPSGCNQISRYSPTITLMAMHRLSELCRYSPVELNAYLNGQKNWLLSEFVEMSPAQYIDEMASEITGHHFAVPNIRAAN